MVATESTKNVGQVGSRNEFFLSIGISCFDYVVGCRCVKTGCENIHNTENHCTGTYSFMYCKSENIRVANSHVINFCVKISWKKTGNENFLKPKFLIRGSIILEAQDLERHGKNTKQLGATEATMNIKYWQHFLPRPLSLRGFSTALFARSFACVGRHVDNDPSGSGRPHFGLK